MPFPLRRLPLLAQFVIIQNSDYSVVLNLSFCSLRMAKTICAAEFKRMSKLCISQHPRFLAFAVQEDQPKKIFVMGSASQVNSSNSDYPLAIKLGNEKISFQYRKNADGSHNYFNEQNLQKLLVEHVLRLLQFPSVRLTVHFDNQSDTSYIIPGVRELAVKSKNINGKCVEFIQRHHNLVFLGTDGPITANPMFSGISYFNIFYTDGWANQILQSSGGRGFHLCETEFGRTDILEFIQKWISGDGYPTLENVMMYFKNEQEDFAYWSSVMDEVALRDYDENTPSRMYTIHSPIMKPTALETKYYRNVKRKTDQQLASFLCMPKSFFFLVWK